MSLLLLFRPRRRRNVGASRSDGGGGGGQRLRVYKNPRWRARKESPVVVEAIKVPTLDQALDGPKRVSELIKFQGSEVPLLQAQQLSLEVLALLQQPYFAVSSPEMWDVPEFLAECGCVLETYMTPEQVAMEQEALLILLMAASE